VLTGTPSQLRDHLKGKRIDILDLEPGVSSE